MGKGKGDGIKWCGKKGEDAVDGASMIGIKTVAGLSAMPLHLLLLLHLLFRHLHFILIPMPTPSCPFLWLHLFILPTDSWS